MCSMRAVGDAVIELHRQGVRSIDIALQLNIAQSTVHYHLRKLADRRQARNVPVAPRAKPTRSSVRTAELVGRLLEKGLSRAEVARRLGLARSTVSYHASRLGGDLDERCRRRYSRGHLKSRLLRLGLKEDRCELCGIADWRGRPLAITLHHANGDRLDNRLENLQLLCPNCHSQTDNYGGRNGANKLPKVS